MSRLQKKKSASEKKRKKADSGNAAPAPEAGNAPKSISPSGPVRPKLEKKSPVTAKPAEPNLIQKGIEFFREVKIELKKVTWPTRKQTTGTTMVVIVFVFVVAIFLGLFDYSLSKLVQVVLT